MLWLNTVSSSFTCTGPPCRLYSDLKLRPKYNLLFVLSGGGNFNYFGTKHLIFEQMDNLDYGSLLTQAEYTICLDEIAFGDDMFVHVSKPPKEGTQPYNVLKTLNQVHVYMDFNVLLIGNQCEC